MTILSKQAGRLPPDLAAAAPPAGPRSLSRRRVLPALAPAGALRARQRGIRREGHQRPRQGQDRIADRTADHRNPGRRRHGVRADQRDFDHRRPDLPGDRTCSTPVSVPPINAGISVSRVGGAAQTDIIKKLGGGIRLALAQYRELAAFSQFASDLDEATRKQLERGQRVTELMKQKQYAPMSVAEMALSLYAVERRLLRQGAARQGRSLPKPRCRPSPSTNVRRAAQDDQRQARPVEGVRGGAEEVSAKNSLHGDAV